MVNGGLGEAVASLAQHGIATRFRIVGIPDEYTITGSQAASSGITVCRWRV